MRGEKHGQMKISFGMIVSIILIVAFIMITFYAISKFLDLQESVSVGKFRSDLQFDIDKIWKSSSGSVEVEYILPNSVEKVCFVDFNLEESGEDELIYSDLKKAYYGSENMIFYPVGSGEGLDSAIIDHIDLVLITSGDNPFCLENKEGKVGMTLKMDFGESLVTITR